jgi:DNA-binding NarL/FixJ family response regulator
VAAVVQGPAPGRRNVIRLLGEGGFDVRSEPQPGALLIVVGQPREDARLREIRLLAESHPNSHLLVVMPAEVPNTAMRRVLLAGASGIVLDDEVERALVPAARAMLAGQLTVPSILGRQIAPRPLSHREKQILSLVMLGMTNREIAHKLFLAESTVKTHLASSFRKLDARSRAEAVARITDSETGFGTGILAIDEPAAA